MDSGLLSAIRRGRATSPFQPPQVSPPDRKLLLRELKGEEVKKRRKRKSAESAERNARRLRLHTPVLVTRRGVAPQPQAKIADGPIVTRVRRSLSPPDPKFGLLELLAREAPSPRRLAVVTIEPRKISPVIKKTDKPRKRTKSDKSAEPRPAEPRAAEPRPAEPGDDLSEPTVELTDEPKKARGRPRKKTSSPPKGPPKWTPKDVSKMKQLVTQLMETTGSIDWEAVATGLDNRWSADEVHERFLADFKGKTRRKAAAKKPPTEFGKRDPTKKHKMTEALIETALQEQPHDIFADLPGRSSGRRLSILSELHTGLTPEHAEDDNVNVLQELLGEDVLCPKRSLQTTRFLDKHKKQLANFKGLKGKENWRPAPPTTSNRKLIEAIIQDERKIGPSRKSLEFERQYATDETDRQLIEEQLEVMDSGDEV